MGVYTELIFGASLKKDTPTEVINTLKYIVGEIKEKPENFPLSEGRCEWLLTGGSYYFGVSEPVTKLWQDIQDDWRLSARCSIKNYGGEIEEFLEWIKPYIDGGSGSRDIYAYTIYEEDREPTIYYLTDGY